MNSYLYKSLLVILITTLLSSCGFHLRGSSELPATIQHAVIDNVPRYSEVGIAIKQQLEASGAKVHSNSDVDTVHFIVRHNEFFKRVLSVDASGRANEYELTYQFSLRVVDAKGALLVNERLINLNRNYIYDINSALAKSDEEASIKSQMIALAVRQAMRRIGIKLKQLTMAGKNNPAETSVGPTENSSTADTLSDQNSPDQNSQP